MTIRNLTDAEARYLREAIELLRVHSPEGTDPRWAADVMLEAKGEDKKDFVARLLYFKEAM